jgi:putative transposase
LIKVAPLLEMVDDWRGFLSLSSSEELDLMHRHERTGRPLGACGFVEGLERTLGRVLRPQKPGPKK